MRIAICHFSNSGNTKLACRRIARSLAPHDVDLIDMKPQSMPELSRYGLVGFAAFTDWFAPSEFVRRWVSALPEACGAPAFVFNTYGFASGPTLRIFARWVRERGFVVTAGHSLHTPESYPPQIARGLGAEDRPNARQLAAFGRFVDDLARVADCLEAKEAPRPCRLPGDPWRRLLPSFSRKRSYQDMGAKHVDEKRCTECGMCERLCPYGAITLDPKPVFDEDACFGCWSCYNHCPEHAAYTYRMRDRAHYPRPNKQLSEKLGQTLGDVPSE